MDVPSVVVVDYAANNVHSDTDSSFEAPEKATTVDSNCEVDGEILMVGPPVILGLPVQPSLPMQLQLNEALPEAQVQPEQFLPLHLLQEIEEPIQDAQQNGHLPIVQDQEMADGEILHYDHLQIGFFRQIDFHTADPVLESYTLQNYNNANTADLYRNWAKYFSPLES
jgi:hypothetical protein